MDRDLKITMLETLLRYLYPCGVLGLEILTGLRQGLLARAIVVIDESGEVMYTELIPEMAQEQDYDAVLDVL